MDQEKKAASSTKFDWQTEATYIPPDVRQKSAEEMKAYRREVEATERAEIEREKAERKELDKALKNRKAELKKETHNPNDGISHAGDAPPLNPTSRQKAVWNAIFNGVPDLDVSPPVFSDPGLSYSAKQALANVATLMKKLDKGEPLTEEQLYKLGAEYRGAFERGFLSMEQYQEKMDLMAKALITAEVKL